MANNEKSIGMKGNCADEEIVGTENKNTELEKEGIIKKTSNENPEQKTKKRIKFGGWLPEVLDWIKRTELAESSLSTSTYIFNRYCWPYLHGRKVKPHTVGSLTFWEDDEDNAQCILEKGRNKIPIAQINPPDYIIGFEQIHFSFIDDRVLQFARKIFAVLNEIILYFDGIFVEHPQNDPIRQMLELMAPKTNKLKLSICVSEFNGLHKFSQQSPGFIFSGVQSIEMYMSTESDTDDCEMVECANGKWPDENARNCIQIFMEFMNSTEPANFIIQLTYNWLTADESFKIENKTTNEILEMQQKHNRYFLVRRKNDGETTQTVDELEKKFRQEPNTMIWIH